MDASTADIEGLTETELRDLLRSAERLLDQKVAQRAKATLKEARRITAFCIGAYRTTRAFIYNLRVGRMVKNNLR